MGGTLHFLGRNILIGLTRVRPKVARLHRLRQISQVRGHHVYYHVPLAGSGASQQGAQVVGTCGQRTLVVLSTRKHTTHHLVLLVGCEEK